jgi:murein DD-endopeptidase MepM/ murein hydrolase activator NlpD
VSPLTVIRSFAPAAENWLPAHRGVDLLARPGQPVRAPRRGTVVFAERIADRPVVVLRSGAVRFTFEPVHVAVPVGRRVPAGARLGTVAAGGHCSGRCLHWGAKIDGRYVDPLSFLPLRTPVLKPVPP